MRTRHVLIFVLMAVLAMLLVISCGGGGGVGGGNGGTFGFDTSQKFAASDGAASDAFGNSVSASSDGTTVVVGSMLDDSNSGSAYVYKWDGSNWSETKLTASDRAAGDYFGRSVSISSDASTIVASAYGDDVGTNTNQGSAYVYKWNGSAWVETKLTASDGAANDSLGNYSGNSVAVSANGNTIIIGAAWDAIGANTNQGSAHIFKWNGSNWIETKIVASDGAAQDMFGKSVAVSSDGNIVAVGAESDDNMGSAYVYKWNGSSWVETKLTASDGADMDFFGRSISMSSDGNTVVVGAFYDNVGSTTRQGSAYVYKWNGSRWAETKITASDGATWDVFGSSVSMSSDGSTFVVGAYSGDVGSNIDQGAAYVYKWNGSTWKEKKLTASDGATGDSFGVSVSISPDGSTAIVGAWYAAVGANTYQGAVYLYK